MKKTYKGLKCSVLIVLLLSGWLCCLSSCHVISNGYGKYIIAFKDDSLKTIERKKSLNNLNDQDFLYHTFSSNNNFIIPYRLLTPVDKQPSEKYPLVITFHNSSRIGSDNKSQLEPLARIWLDANVRKKYRAYVLAPQFAVRSSIYTTDNQKGILISKPEANLLAIVDLINELQERYNIDEQRIYLVGYSMGASSVINLLNLKPDKFAAAVAIAGVPQFENSKMLSHIPVWLIHGASDDENPFMGSEKLYKYISGQHKTRYWVFKNRTHNNIISTQILDESIPACLLKNIKKQVPLSKIN